MGNSSTYTIKAADECFKNAEVKKSIQLLYNMDCHEAVSHALTTIRLKAAHDIIDELMQVVEHALNNASNDTDKQLYTKIIEKFNCKEEPKTNSPDIVS
jgi:hypothetical protein